MSALLLLKLLFLLLNCIFEGSDEKFVVNTRFSFAYISRVYLIFKIFVSFLGNESVNVTNSECRAYPWFKIHNIIRSWFPVLVFASR